MTASTCPCSRNSAQHPPLNRQADRHAREGVPLSLSTLADQVGGCCAVLAPLIWRIERHVFAAERLHSDDTIVPVLAKGKTHGAMLGLTARRPSVWRAGAAGGDVLLLAGSVWRAPAGTSGGVCRDLSSRCLWRLHQAVRGRPQAGSIGRGGVLGPCPPAVLHPGRCRCQCPPQGAGQNRQPDLAAGTGGGSPH